MNDTEQTLTAIASEVAELKRSLDYKKDIDSLRAELTAEGQKTALEELRKAIDYQKEISTLRAEVTLQLSYFKWVAWSAGLCLAVIGFFGFKAWSDLTKSAETLMTKQLGEMSERYSNLSRGFSFQDSGRSKEALPYLTALYDSNRYDEPVLRALLDALTHLNDCEAIITKVAEVKSDKSKFNQIKDPMVFNALGYSLRDCFDYKPEVLRESQEMLELSLKRIVSDDLIRRYLLYHLFSYHLISNDLARAKNFLENTSIVVADYPDMETIKQENWYRKLSNIRPSLDAELAPMIESAVKLQRETFRKDR